MIHGDVKLENVLVRRSDQSVKLIDFGFSQVYKEGVALEVGCVLFLCFVFWGEPEKKDVFLSKKKNI